MLKRATIELLGPFQVRKDDGALVSVPQAHHRIVLAALALAGDRGMSPDRLLAVIWGDQAPRSARKTLHGYIARLRRLLGPGSIVTRPGGYCLNRQHFELDADVAGSYLDASRVSPSAGERLRLYGQALALFRGDPLEDVPSALLEHTYGAALRDAWTRALEDWAREQIRVDPPRAIEPLRAACARQPHRESAWALLVEALTACERRAEALESYQRARRILIDDLGIEPGLSLREAQARALAPVPEPRGENGERPARRAEQAAGRLRGDRARGAAIALAGPPGAGKTRIAAEVAAAVSPVFGGESPVAVSAISADGDASPKEIAAAVLRSWDLGRADDPPGGVLNAWLRRQGVIVLDDVTDVRQFEWLLPVPPRCGLIICTTMPAAAVQGPDVFELSAYPLSDVLRLLGHARPGQAPTLTGQVTRTLDQVLEGLPAAVHSLAARVAAEPGLELAEIATRLQDPRRRLGELTSRSIDVRAHLHKAYDRLSSPGRRAFRLLGWLNSHSFTDAVAAAALQLPDSETGMLVAEMTRVGLVRPEGRETERRHRISHLGRSLAREISDYTDDPSMRDAAVRRALRAWHSSAAPTAGLSAGLHHWEEAGSARPLMRP